LIDAHQEGDIISRASRDGKSRRCDDKKVD